MKFRVPHRRLAIVLVFLVLFAPSFALAADLPHSLEVRLVLCQRTYPRLDDNSTARLGPILYPKYVDLRGDVTLYGDAEYVREAAQTIRTLDSRKILQRFRIHIHKRKDGQTKLLPNAVRSIHIDEVRVFTPAQQGAPPNQREGVPTIAEFQFIASVDDSTWTEGRYLLSTEWRAGADVEPRTLGTRIQPFEVRRVKPGGADEINLLTNALGMVPGLAARLQQQGRYQVEKMPGRILELDEHDVWIRAGQAEKALQMVRPQEAIEFYDAAWKEVSAGTAHRSEVIWNIVYHRSCRSHHNLPSVTDLFALRIEQVKQQAMTMNAARAEVEKLYKEKGIPALLELVRTPNDSSLYKAQECAYEAIFAIRLLGKTRTEDEDVVQTLVSELRKLPGENYAAYYEQEIVAALATIHERPDKRIDSLALTPEQNIDVIRWWQKRP